MADVYSIEEVQWLNDNYSTCTHEEAEKALGRRWGAIMNYCNRVGLRRRKMKKYNGSVDCKVLPSVGNIDCVEVNDLIKTLGISMQELEMWTAVYPEEIGIYSKKGKKVIIINDLFKFLKKNQDLWDSTKVQKEFFDDCKWYEKKHEEDFRKMIQRRWGKDAK